MIKNEILVPSEFLSLARRMGMPKEVAVNYYTRKLNNKSDIKDLTLQLSNSVYETEMQARKALTQLWVEFNKLNIDLPHIPVEVSARAQSKTAPDRATYLEEAREALQRMIGHLQPAKYDGRKTAQDRIVVGGDIHGLFCDMQAFERFANDPAQTCILVGDFCDLYAGSRYRHALDHITVREELADARAKAEYLASKFKRIYSVAGNHDLRAVKKLQDVAPQLLPLMVDPLDLIFSGIPQFQSLKTVVPGTKPSTTRFAHDTVLPYCGMVGDILVGHFENFCGVDAPRQVDNWLMNWGHILKLATEPRVILQGHSHAMSMTCTAQGKRLISTGCLCQPMEYQLDGHGRYNPPTVGYLALYQREGKTDLASIEFHTLT